MHKQSNVILIVALLVGAVAGAVCGWHYGARMVGVAFIGEFFLNALKMIVVPLVLSSIIVGVSSLGDVRQIGRFGWKTLSYYLCTTVIAVSVGLFLVNIMQPGVGAVLGNAAPATVASKEMGLQDIVLSFVHPNLFGAMAETKVLPIIVFALLFGGVLTTLGAKGRGVMQFFDAVNDALIKIVYLILWLAPVGVFALVASRLGAAGGGAAFMIELQKVSAYCQTVLLGLAIHGMVILPLIVWVLGRRNPLRYFWNASEVLVTAISTSSSSATLPVSLQVSKERNKIPGPVADFVLPIGATVNMDGTALYEAVAAMFVAQAYGVHLSLTAQLVIMLTAVLASVGAAGIPQAGLVTMVLVFQAVGLPLEGIGLILAVDWFLDRFRTVVNVWGDLVGAAVISRTREGQRLAAQQPQS